MGSSLTCSVCLPGHKRACLWCDDCPVDVVLALRRSLAPAPKAGCTAGCQR